MFFSEKYNLNMPGAICKIQCSAKLRRMAHMSMDLYTHITDMRTEVTLNTLIMNVRPTSGRIYDTIFPINQLISITAYYKRTILA